MRLNRAIISFNIHISRDATASVVLFFPNHDGAERLVRSSIRLLPNLATTDVRNFTFLIKLLELSVLVRQEEVTCTSMRAHAWRCVSEESRFTSTAKYEGSFSTKLPFEGKAGKGSFAS